ncbi:MAG TPA: GAF domain-containing protein [Vicinamibacteria bacterium]|nr:GAF domain-containing protein [Vicinamibacteria bacterium]
MNTDRLLREIEKRLGHLGQGERDEVLDAVREEIGRERRWQTMPEGPVEVERERRLEAETLRDVLEAINRPSGLDDTLDEVLKQLSRIVSVDSCSLSLLDAEGRFRIIAGRGFAEQDQVIGAVYGGPLTDSLRQQLWPIGIDDVAADERWSVIPGSGPIRSWAGLPLLMEGELIGLLCLDRHRVEPFDEEDLHRAKAVAFSAAAAIRRAQVLEKVQRYVTLMERVSEVDQAVFAGRSADQVAALIVEGARRIGNYPGGLFVTAAAGKKVVAASGALEPARGKAAPAGIVASRVTRLDAATAERLGRALGLKGLAQGLYLVPLSDGDKHLATLALLDADGPGPEDRLVEAYGSRAASAWRHALRPRS